MKPCRRYNRGGVGRAVARGRKTRPQNANYYPYPGEMEKHSLLVVILKEKKRGNLVEEKKSLLTS